GPLLIALMLFLKGGYRTGFGVLLIPALVCLGILVVARFLHPRPQELEELSAQPLATRYLTPTYWIYLGGGCLIAAGFADFALIGMILWGIGMSAQGSLLQAMLTAVIPAEKRSTAFGLFDTGYGIAWFLGSATMGLLYEKSILALVVFSVVLQLAALPLLFIANKSR